MNFEKLTQRSQGFIQAAQNLAVRNSNQFLTPEHLLKVMLDDKEGMASKLLQAAGADVPAVKMQVEEELSKLPVVQGSGVQVSSSQSFLKVLDLAEQIAEKAKDSYVTVERLLQALLMAHSYGVDVQKLNQVINDMRQGRTAQNDTAEDTYDALEKYATDYTKRAREGKLDPVIGRDEEIRHTIPQNGSDEQIAEAVCDYIANMTDIMALEEHNKLFNPLSRF